MGRMTKTEETEATVQHGDTEKRSGQDYLESPFLRFSV
jgi:hypothetical protein